MIESYKRTGTRTVRAEYTGMKDRRWAVVVMADRMIQAEHPDLVVYLTTQITQRLVDNNEGVGAAGYVPADRLLRHLYDHPQWVTKPRGQLAKELGVDRLIVVEVLQYRLNDPGNQYLWAGEATGTVGVIEAESPLPDEFAFERPLRVRFPDRTGVTQAEMPRAAVNTALALRLADRAAWLFYTHEEPYYPDY